MLLQADGLAHTDASISAFLTPGYVVLLLIVAAVSTRRAPQLRVAICTLLVLVGLAVLARFDPRTLSLGRGEVETLAAAACFTVQILLVGADRYAHNRANPMTTVMFAVIGVVLVPVVAANASRPSDYVLL